MSEAVAIVLAAVVAASGSIIVAMIHALRKENREDHGVVRQLLENLDKDIKQVGTKLHDHIDWHLDNPTKKGQ